MNHPDHKLLFRQPQPHYSSSGFFPPIKTEMHLAEARAALAELYGVERRTSCHRGMRLRERAVFREDLKWFLHFVQPPAEVFECGAGTGTFAVMLAEAGFRVTAGDIYEEEDLSTLRRRHQAQKNLRFERLESVLRSNDRFDAIISINVLEHILFPDRTIHQWKTLLRPGGTLSVICPNYSGIISPLKMAIGILSGGSRWRYQGVKAALGHCRENILLNIKIALTGRSVFVRCMPQIIDGRIIMSDSDLDTVHLPSARGILNFLREEGLRIVSWRRSYGSLLKRAVTGIFPGQAPTMRINARLS